MYKEEKPETVAVFDFDGTLTRRDSLPYFLAFFFGTRRTIFNFLQLSPYFIGFALHLITRDQIKEKILTKFLKGVHASELETWGERFAKEQLNDLIKEEAKQRFLWHQQQHHTCILASANLDFYLHPWAKNNGFRHALTSECEVDEKGFLTGKLKGKNCWGKEKVVRLNQLLGSANPIIYAYGNSKGDAELLLRADYSFYRRFG